MSRFAGMPVIVSEHATEERRPREPITDDMRVMVEDLWPFGAVVTRRVPCAYRMLDTLIVHPVIYATLQRYNQTIRPQTIVDYGNIIS